MFGENRECKEMSKFWIKRADWGVKNGRSDNSLQWTLPRAPHIYSCTNAAKGWKLETPKRPLNRNAKSDGNRLRSALQLQQIKTFELHSDPWVCFRPQLLSLSTVWHEASQNIAKKWWGSKCLQRINRELEKALCGYFRSWRHCSQTFFDESLVSRFNYDQHESINRRIMAI